MQQAHHTTVDLSSSRLTLREELTFHLQEYQKQECYLIEDELNSKYYRIGLSEYQLISQFDGLTSVGEATARNAAAMGDQALSEQDATTLCKWLIDSQLATTTASRSSGRLTETFQESDRRKKMARLNPLTPKFPLFNPQRLLQKVNGLFGWIFSLPVFAVWCIVVLIGCYSVFGNWNQVFSSQQQVLDSSNWIWLGLTWIVLKVLHEFGHGMACQRFDGEVREAGIVMILAIPLPFVDVTSSWRLRSKWRRIFIAAAGMYVEIFIAAIAAIVWSQSDPGVLRSQAWNIVLAGSFTTLIFNANPLMRFDGYYMLSDWLEMPNLGTHAQAWSKWLGKRFYLGMDVRQPTWPEGRGVIVGVYAILSLVWKVLICVGLALAAEAMFFGAGIVLAVLAVVMWVVVPIYKLLSFIFVDRGTGSPPSRIRFCVTTLAVAVIGYAFLNYTPWHARITAPAVVQFRDHAEVRSITGGFVTEVVVRPGQQVREGQTIARMRNEELELQVHSLQLEAESSEIRARQLMDSRQIAALQAERENLSALRQQLSERREQLGALEIRAGIAGIVIGENLDSMVGRWLAPGETVCAIGSSGPKELLALVDQNDIDLFRGHQGADVRAHVWGQGQLMRPAKLTRIVPRASTSLPHDAFSAANGGSLPVKYAADEQSEPSFEAAALELVEPRFSASVSVDDEESHRLRAGQKAQVSFRASRGSVWDVLSESTVQWIRRQRAAIRGTSL